MADQPIKRAAEPSRSDDLSRSHTGPAQPSPSRADAEPQPRSRGSEVDIRTMIVGPETSFSGEITSCNRLIVEGTIEARLDNCQNVIIDESGVFAGSGVTDNADVYGSFAGDLVVRKRLLIRATGRLSGTIRYGEIEIERGGKIVGAIEVYDGRENSHVRRPLAAKAQAMKRNRGKTARPRDYDESETADKNSADRKDGSIPGI